MEEMRLQDMKGFRIGSSENLEAGTGCTVILCDKPSPCSVDVRGGGPRDADARAVLLGHEVDVHRVAKIARVTPYAVGDLVRAGRIPGIRAYRGQQHGRDQNDDRYLKLPHQGAHSV